MSRTSHKKDVINALTEAQKIAFAPLSFQAVSAMLDLGILKEIDKSPKTSEELIEMLNLSEYTVNTLLEVAEVMKVVTKKGAKFYSTSLAEALLYDEMTRVNFNFTKDVCFDGSTELKNSFLDGKPQGFRKMFPEAETIYPYLSKLPPVMQKSWYEFDHYYSDNCFKIIYKILENEKKIFDIGGNTGKFEKVCLKNNPKCDITMIDLPANIDVIKNDKELSGCKFVKCDVLNPKSDFPQISGVALMSQFLDCFSKEQIGFILNRIKNNSASGTKIYILEPFLDRQKFDGAKFSLAHTSLYFTCMANGCSKMYSYDEMREIVEQAGFEILNCYDSLGAHDYTLLECVKND